MTTKLSDSQVRKIQRLYATTKYTQQVLADRFKVCRPLISMIINGRRGRKRSPLPKGDYKILKLGKARYAVYNTGKIWTIKNNKFLKPDTNNKGYKFVRLGKDEKKFYVHRLVLQSFIGDAKSGQECRHRDGNPSNNRLDNLKWGSAKKNASDKHLHKTAGVGETNHQSVIPDLLLSHLLFAAKHSNLTEWEFSMQLGETLGIHPATIASALKRKYHNNGVLDRWNK